MSALKMFTFVVTNQKTGESAKFIGQGTTLEEAVSEAVKNLSASPSLNVELPNGARVARTKKEFEGDEPFTQAKRNPLQEPTLQELVEEDCP